MPKSTWGMRFNEHLNYQHIQKEQKTGWSDQRSAISRQPKPGFISILLKAER